MRASNGVLCHPILRMLWNNTDHNVQDLNVSLTCTLLERNFLIN
uniref:Uncharacterized protein n=1 Tax=Meloidogyne enterolobii TaxID=390850 RepID=A0A6V7TI94_MELEN|nr:unnamed protein product [Meloidogyne enterolobii]